MPELPEVETVRRGLSPVLEGAEIAEVLLRRADLRIPFPPGFAARLAGRRVLSLGRKAKYLLATLDDGTVWITHLGMSGRMAVHDGVLPAAGRHDHVELRLDGGRTVRFTDPRRFGLMTLAEPGALDTHPLLAHLGMDPLSNAFNGPALAAALAGKRGPIKAALLDQRVVAGLGNIYVCESLYRAGLSPKRRAGTVRGVRAERLARAVKDTLAEAIDAGGSTLRDHAAPDGALGYFQHSFKVYGREGLACPDCDCELARTGGVQRMVQTGRSTFYCPRRQR